MKKIIFLGMCLCVLSSYSEKSDAPPAFTNFTQAITFIDKCLDDNATNRFVTAFVEPRSHEQMRINVFNNLKRYNQRNKLASLYPGREFPENDTLFGLGGHFKELGCVHIIFNQTNNVWILKDTFICR